MKILAQLKNVDKVYGEGDMRFVALSHVNLEIKKGEFLAITGPSGSGKSTLMNIIGLLDMPTQGTYKLDGEEVNLMNENKLANYRNKKIGFVFQSFNLLPRTTAQDNVALPLIYSGVSKKDRIDRAQKVLISLGLGDKLQSRPNQLSGGQQQRVAIARALVTNPEIILADEPTGNLDTKTGIEIMKIFRELNEAGKTIVLITHESEIAKNAKRIVVVKDGKLK